MRLAEHRAGLTDTRGRTEIDAQRAASVRRRAPARRFIGCCLWRHRLIVRGHMDIIPSERSRLDRILAVQLKVELQNVNPRLAEETEQTPMLVVANRVTHLRSTDAARPGHPRHLDRGVRR